jgi:tripartite-type tricarboxylate transporter receptor subunit TctC
MMVTPLLVEAHARAGKLRLIAAATRERIPRLPDLPTVSESGVPGYDAGTWFALAGPAGMPAELTHAIYDAVKNVLYEPAFKEKYIDKQWFEIVANTPEQFTTLLGAEFERWENLIRLSGVKVQ